MNQQLINWTFKHLDVLLWTITVLTCIGFVSVVTTALRSGNRKSVQQL